MGEAMWLDALVLLLVVLLAVLGAMRGTLATGMKLVSLIGAYAVAILCAGAIAGPLASALSLPRVLGVPLAGTLLFLAAYALLGALAFALQRLERRWRGDWPRTPADRAGGIAFGLARGVLVALLLGWLGLWMEGLRMVGGVTGLPSAERSQVADMTGNVVETGGDILVGDDSPTLRVTTRMMAHPARNLELMEQVLDNPRVEELRDDQIFWMHVAHGSTDAALNRGSFLSIAYDDTLRRQFGELGLVSESAAVDPRLFRNSLKETLEEVQPRVQAVLDDPALHEMLDDPEVQRALREGDTLVLLRHPGFQGLFDRATRD
jgi:uncharacterized membrane protein required for colicin V production